MAINTSDFNKIWASTSPLTPYAFSDANYQEGWNFVGGTPPARQMWDSIQKLNDEKSKFLYELAQMIVPVGVVQAFAGSNTPNGWLLCDGSAVSRTDYAELYSVIGDTYGAGDGSTTFNLPDLVDKFVQGNATSGTEKSAGLPNITGTIKSVSSSGSEFYLANDDNPKSFGNSSLSSNTTAVAGSPTTTNIRTITKLKLDASLSSAIYGNSTTVQPPALTMRYIIKY